MVVVIANDKDRAKVAAAVGPTVKILKITTPGQVGGGDMNERMTIILPQAVGVRG